MYHRHKEFLEGCQAYQHRLRPDANKYEEGTEEYNRWLRGWKFEQWLLKNKLNQYYGRNKALI